MDTKIIAAAIAALLVGAGGGYFLGDSQGQGRIATLTKQAADADAQAKTLQGKLTTAEGLAQQLDTTAKSLGTQLAAAQTQLSSAQGQVATLTAKKVELEASLSALGKQLDVSTAASAKLTSGLAAVNKQLDAAKLQTAQAEADLDAATAKYQALVGKLVVGDPATGAIRKTYVWSYKFDEWSLTVDIPTDLYSRYARLGRSMVGDFAAYVAHPDDDAFVKKLAGGLTALAAERGLVGDEPAELAISFVQQLIYTYDNVTEGAVEYYRFPLETLADGGGDCEDTAILLASILKEMGRSVVFVVLPNHVALGVTFTPRPGSFYSYGGLSHWYVETTGENYPIGKIPEAYVGSATLQAVQPAPFLTYRWTGVKVGGDWEITYTVRNNGTAAASGYRVRGAFDDGNNVWWNGETVSVPGVAVGGTVTGKFTLRTPPGKHVRLAVELQAPDGSGLESQYGAWFDT